MCARVFLKKPHHACMPVPFSCTFSLRYEAKTSASATSGKLEVQSLQTQLRAVWLPWTMQPLLRPGLPWSPPAGADRAAMGALLGGTREEVPLDATISLCPPSLAVHCLSFWSLCLRLCCACGMVGGELKQSVSTRANNALLFFKGSTGNHARRCLPPFLAQSFWDSVFTCSG